MTIDTLAYRGRRRTGLLVPDAISGANSLGSQSFSTTQYQGNSSGYGVGVGFQPDLVLVKNLLAISNHKIVDSVRGPAKVIITHSTSAETNDPTGLTSFHSNGFTVANSADYCVDGGSFLSFNWKRSPEAGLDIIAYTGTGVARTVDHNLGQTPELILIKRLTSAGAWGVYNGYLDSPQSEYLILNTTAAKVSDTTYWNGASATSTNFSLGTNTVVNASGSNYIAYVFSSKSSRSQFGRYTGNGSATGPTVVTNFMPSAILIKRIDTTGAWHWYARLRGGTTYLLANTNSSEVSGITIGFRADGFQLLSNSSGVNATGGIYTYAAWR